MHIVQLSAKIAPELLVIDSTPVDRPWPKRSARFVVRLAIISPARRPILAALRAATRHFGSRRWRALAFYAGEALGQDATLLRGRLRTGSHIYLFARDRMHRHIYFYGDYEESTTRFFHRIARPGWTVLDVGANAGYFSLLANDLGGPSSSIHAFEPNPQLLQILEKSASGHRSIHVVPVACGERPGSGKLRLSPDVTNTGLSTIRSDVIDGPVDIVAVPIITLDQHCEHNGLAPDLIKIDVEGYELSVLLGAAQLLKAGVPAYIVCEFAPGRSETAALLETMAGFGYVPRSLTAAGHLRDFRDDYFQNMVFLRR